MRDSAAQVEVAHLADVDAKLPVESAAHFHRIKERAAANLFEWDEPLPLQLAKVSQARAGRFVGKDEAQASFRADKSGGCGCIGMRGSVVHRQLHAR